MSGGEFIFAAVFGVVPLYWCGLHAVAGVVCALVVLYVLARWFMRTPGRIYG